MADQTDYGRAEAYQTRYHDETDGTFAKAEAAHTRFWDPNSLTWVRAQVDASGNLKVVSAGGAGGGPATIADGADVAEGATTDAAVITDTTGTVSGKLRGLVKWAFERMPASLGQKAMAASLPVVIASDQSALTADVSDRAARLLGVVDKGKVWDGTNTAAVKAASTTPVAADPALVVSLSPNGAAQPATAVQPVSDNAGSLTVDAPVGTPVAARLSDGAAFYDAAKTGQLPAALVGGRLDENVGAWLGSTAPTVGQKAMASSVPVVIASDQSAVPVSGTVTANPATAVGKTLTFVPVAQGAAGTTVIAAASPSNKHKIVGVVLTLSASGTLKFTDGAGDLTGAMDIAAQGGFVLPTSIIPYQQTTIVNTALSLVTTGGAAKGVVIVLTEA